MRITTLGCNGNITGNLRTNCYQIDHDILIDAILAPRTSSPNVIHRHRYRIPHHSRLTTALSCLCWPTPQEGARDVPLTIYALPETIATLRRHMLNPAVGRLHRSADSRTTRYLLSSDPTRRGHTLSGRSISALPARHSIPCASVSTAVPPAWCIAPTATFMRRVLAGTQSHRPPEVPADRKYFSQRQCRPCAGFRQSTADLWRRGLHLLERPVNMFIVHMEAESEKRPMCESRSGRSNRECCSAGTYLSFRGSERIYSFEMLMQLLAILGCQRTTAQVNGLSRSS